MPVLSPTPEGSIVIVEGPLIVLDVTLIADPSAPVWKAVAVTIPEETEPPARSKAPPRVNVPTRLKSPPTYKLFVVVTTPTKVDTPATLKLELSTASPECNLPVVVRPVISIPTLLVSNFLALS